METISILAALDENYLPQLQVMLTSMYLNNPGERADIYLLYSSIPEDKLAAVKKQLDFMGYGFYPIPVDRTLFDGAPVTKQYPREMYYRLLASRFLPEKLDRVMEHTAVLHFCGKAKPWKPGYVYRFGVLYKHYARVASRLFLKEEGERHED